MSIKKLALGALALTFSYSALANSHTSADLGGNFYVSGHYSALMHQGEDNITITPTGVTPSSPAIYFNDKNEAYKTDFKLGHQGGIAIGYSYAGSPRVELEAIISETKSETSGNENIIRYVPSAALPNDAILFTHSGYSTTGAMLNVYYDFSDYETRFAPYLGAGFGITRTKFLDISRNNMSYQLKAGASTAVQQSVRAYLGYTYHGIVEGDGFEKATGIATGASLSSYIDSTIKMPFKSHHIEAGLFIAV